MRPVTLSRLLAGRVRKAQSRVAHVAELRDVQGVQEIYQPGHVCWRVVAAIANAAHLQRGARTLLNNPGDKLRIIAFSSRHLCKYVICEGRRGQ